MQRKPNEKLPRIYLSGIYQSAYNSSELDFLKRSKCKYRCYSYIYTAKGASRYSKRLADSLEIDVKKKIGIMMDSSAHTFHKLPKKRDAVDINKLRDQVIDGYVQYSKAYGKEWDFYVNFDYVKKSPIIYKMQQRLEKAGIRPTPVFHGDDGFKWLERYVKEGYDFICIGNVSRGSWDANLRYYDKCFDIAAKGKDVKLHGLAVTGFNLMFAFPWYAVDSATWAKNAAFGMIVTTHPVNNQFMSVHVSDQSCSTQKSSINNLEPSIQKAIINEIEAAGFNYSEVRKNGYERAVYNARIYANIHKFKPENTGEMFTKWEPLI